MIAGQIRDRGIADRKVLDALMRVPRHEFVPAEHAAEAYDDHPLCIGAGQTISQPYIVALMTQALSLSGGEKVLEIGTGSGYQTAILAEIAGEVYSVERIPELARSAEVRLRHLGYSNIRIRVGDGTLGWPEHSPFDAILVAAAAPSVPKSLKAQLGDGGRLVIPVGSDYSQMLKRITRVAKDFSCDDLCPCVFVKLIGEEGHEDL